MSSNAANKSDKKTKSEIILDQISASEKKSEQVQVDEETVQIIIFLLDDAHFALPAEKVFEINENQRIFPVPGTPNFVLGVLNLRGDIVSILSIKVLLKLTDEDAQTGQRVIYTKIDDNIVGFLVDKVEEVLDFPISSVKTTLSTLDKMKKEFIQGEVTFNDQLIPLLNIEKVFERAIQTIDKATGISL